MVTDLGYPTKDIHRPAIRLIQSAGVRQYAKPFHTLRKNREQDWIEAGIPFHVVIEWIGHSHTVAQQHYLRVDETHIKKATRAID